MVTGIDLYEDAFHDLPLVAILRGIRPSEADGIAESLHGTGFRFIEVPLNSPKPFETIERFVSILPDTVLIGAGTVLDADDVQRLHDVGGRLMVSPNVAPDVIGAARERGMVSMPGAMTPTECFAALKAGATGLKIFPAGQLGPGYIKDIRAVLPMDAAILPVGGIGEDNMEAFLAAGASGFGFSSAIYKPGMTANTLRARAEALVAAYRKART